MASVAFPLVARRTREFVLAVSGVALAVAVDAFAIVTVRAGTFARTAAVSAFNTLRRIILVICVVLASVVVFITFIYCDLILVVIATRAINACHAEREKAYQDDVPKLFLLHCCV